MTKKKLPLPRNQPNANRNSPAGKKREWEPTPRYWAMYERVCSGMSYRQVGAEFEVSFQAVGQICKRVDEYLAAHHIEQVRQIRVRHTNQLENIFCEAMAAWQLSKEAAVTKTLEVGDVDGKPSSKRKKQEANQYGNPAFLSEAMRALADIRKIHAVDKNPRVDELAAANDAADRVAGKSRELLIQERINALNASLKMSQALSSTPPEQAG